MFNWLAFFASLLPHGLVVTSMEIVGTGTKEGMNSRQIVEVFQRGLNINSANQRSPCT